MKRLNEFQTVFDFELPTLVEEEEKNVQCSTYLKRSSSSGDLFLDNSICQPEMTSGSVFSDFLSPSESTSLSMEEDDCSPCSTRSTEKCPVAKFSSFHAPFSSHLGLISDKLESKEFHRRVSADNHLSNKLWTDNCSAKTLPGRLNETTISDRIHANGGRNKLKSFSMDGKSKSPVQEVDDHLLHNGTLEHQVQALEKELKKVRELLLEKEQKCDHLMKLQNAVDSEVQDLTETLFQEAYKMVNTADEKRDRAERLLAEAKLKLDLLQAEVGALKSIVKTTTPKRSSKNNMAQRFLNNSIGSRTSESQTTPSKKSNNFFSSSPKQTPKTAVNRPSEVNEVDPIYYKELVMWRESALGLDESCLFLNRILSEDVHPCLVFQNVELAEQVLQAIKANALEMEPINKEEAVKARECSLLQVRKDCAYRLRTSSEAQWQFVCLLARNRIAAVCDFFTFLRYLHRGICKPSLLESYWNIVNLRKNMTLAKLGLHFVLKMNGSSPSEDC